MAQLQTALRIDRADAAAKEALDEAVEAYRRVTAPERGWREVVNLLALVAFVGLLVHYTMPDELA